MRNAEISRLFDELADLLEVEGANAFRVRAYRNAARTIESYSGSLTTLAGQGVSALTELPGIGDDLAKKIVTIVNTQRLPQLDEIRQRVPPVVLEMLRIPNLGPKKAAALVDALQIKSLDELRAAAEQDRIASLKGFGAKSQRLILEGLAQPTTTDTRYLISDARSAADPIVADLQQSQAVVQVTLAGSSRRGRETCADLDVIATSADVNAVMDRLAANSSVENVLQRGETKQRVRLFSGIEMDLRVVPEESYGAALVYFTGSKAHNIELRRRAQERGLKINEYGVFRGEERIAGRTEEEVYAAVDLPWIPPELREDRGEFARAEAGTLPELVTLADIRGDLHMHTTATDGKATIREMAEAAKERGLKYIAITDHSKRVSMARGLDAARLRAHWDEIDKVRGEVHGIEILRGVECDILENATMDLDDQVLSEADWVIGVLHYGLKQPRETIMRRLMAAIQNPHVDIIGHPSGRLLTRREGADIDFDEFLKAAADHGVMLEINADPHRLDLDDVHAAAAKDLGIPIVISTDAHSTGGLDLMHYGVQQARRAGLEKADIANTRSFAQFRKLLRRP
ncbi:MAG: DNA polymerase/3'-5' exonuclease PolX [Planctomycetaceae bacterium]|nr:DNA polymerase/3'-5' exonuclease PolX [Planctomycetaceae bacterium]